ncbi:MAG: bifunctional methylenetetrahydrofolate dehydrogenase/methenyltetrahydrofolate cyclohydrolase FolD [Chrysiogenetes bacterium]|nr:bifunctional methylenetetrahydrofolate dehydrogenase/methenyltetrahydrofolate cyclohydrolase FolD [Chrysiogenetes bacterium]
MGHTDTIDGKKIAAEVRAKVAEGVKALQASKGVTPGLAVILVGTDPASQVYVRSKGKAAGECGLNSWQFDYDEDVDPKVVFDKIAELNADENVHGILVQLPLPKQFDPDQVIEAIHPDKDVDGFHPVNMGRLLSGLPGLRPCTPSGCMELIDHTNTRLEGAEAVVVGRSNIVGKPVAVMLLERNCTVTICHSRTEELPHVIGRADIVIAAVGRPEFIEGEWIKPGATVIDVGMNRKENGKLCGDVGFEAASGRAAHITPVPGGVGPMTIAFLLKNTLQAAEQLSGAR